MGSLAKAQTVKFLKQPLYLTVMKKSVEVASFWSKFFGQILRRLELFVVCQVARSRRLVFDNREIKKRLFRLGIARMGNGRSAKHDANLRAISPATGVKRR